MIKLILAVLIFCSYTFAKDTLFCDQGLATGANSGASTADAWQDLQTALDNADSTDVVKYKISGGGEFTLTVPFDFDTKSGTITSDRIEIVGVNNSWIEDGAIVWLNCNDAVDYGFTSMTSSYYEIRNIGIKKAAIANVNMSTGDFYTFINCHADSGVHGFYGSGGSTYLRMINCSANDNDSNGIYNIGNNGERYYFCSFNRNGYSGAFPYLSDNLFIGCNFIDNLRVAVRNLASEIYFSTLDGTNVANDTGIIFSSSGYFFGMYGVTNFALAVNGGTTRYGNTMYGRYYGNTDDSSNVARTRYLRVKSEQTNIFNIGEDDGYVNKATGNYNLKAGVVGKLTPVRMKP